MRNRTPEQRATHAAYMRAYNQRPEVRARRKAYNKLWAKRNPDKFRMWVRAASARFREKHRSVLAVYNYLRWQALPEAEKQRRRDLSRQWREKNLTPEMKTAYKKTRAMKRARMRELMGQQGLPRNAFRCSTQCS